MYLAAGIFAFEGFFAPLSPAKFFPAVERFGSHKERQSAFRFTVFVLIFLRGREALQCRCKTILFEYWCVLFFSCFSFNTLRCQSCLSRSSLSSLQLLSFSLFASLLAFHAYARAHSGIPHCRNNYYYESDPGQETTIVSSFLLLALPIPSSSTTRLPRRSLADPTQNPRGLFYSRLASSRLRLVDGIVETLGGSRRVIITAKVGETPLEN